MLVLFFFSHPYLLFVKLSVRRNWLLYEFRLKRWDSIQYNLDNPLNGDGLRSCTGVNLFPFSQLSPFITTLSPDCRSQWPRGLRHELFSPALTLGSSFESHSRHGCLSTFIRCLCCPVYVAALRRADHSSQESYWLQEDQETEVKRSVSRMPCAPEGATGI
jgi:hypothetical protein